MLQTEELSSIRFLYYFHFAILLLLSAVYKYSSEINTINSKEMIVQQCNIREFYYSILELNCQDHIMGNNKYI